MTVSATRLDALVRSERYFTATLLPAILFHDDLRGLGAFLELVDSRARRQDGCATERDRSGNAAPRRQGHPTWRPETVEVITEFHIARDLAFAGKLGTADTASPSGQASEREKRDAPDLVIVLDDELVVCEGKFFDPCDLTTFNRQLRSQRRQVRYLFTVRPGLRAYRHVTILPVEFNEPPDCDAVLTWSDIADLAAQVLGPVHYVTGRLGAAVERYQALVGDPDVKNYDAVLSLDAMLERCRVFGDAIHVGHAGGEANLLRRPLAYLEGKPWRCRDPRTNTGVAIPKNWILGTRFVELIERRREHAAAANRSVVGGEL
jgi:hypothetical protein